MRDKRFSHVDTWVFDLDQTLYPKSSNLETEVVRSIMRYLSANLQISLEEAGELTSLYHQQHGATVLGAHKEHGIPLEHFIEVVYWELGLQAIQPNPALREALLKLSGRRIIFTNAPRYHAERVLERLGIADLFDDIVDVIAFGYHPKPNMKAYRALLKQTGINPKTSAFFEDSERNLKVAARLGMRTVHIYDKGKPAEGRYIDAVARTPEEWINDNL